MNPGRREKPEGKSTVVAKGARDLAPVALPTPRFDGRKTLFTAIKNRKTVRDVRDEGLPPQVLSNLLWAACGVNRKRGPFGVPGRTAGSASNSQEIEVYVLLAKGTYLYDAWSHSLMPVAEGDLRPLAIGPGQQEAGANAPVRLVYVVDLDKFSKAGFQEPGLYDAEVQKSYYYVDTGLIAQNVYLFASSEGLAAWFHNCDRRAVARELGLRPAQHALFGQTVGYPAEK
jgi:hypothetical protein